MYMLRYMLKRAAFVFVFTLFQTPAYADFFGSQEFKSISCLSEQILAKYPSEDFAIIGVGRSPTPITTYLKTNSERATWNLPISQFRYTIGGVPALGKKEEEKLFQHFDIYFPSPAELKGRDIVLIDFCVTGDSLVAAKYYLEKYLKRSGRSAQVKPLCIIQDFRAREIKHQGIDMLELGNENEALTQKFIDAKYDKFAEYDAFDIASDSIASKRKDTKNSKFPWLSKNMQVAKIRFSSVVQRCHEEADFSGVRMSFAQIVDQISALSNRPAVCEGRDQIAQIVGEAALRNEERIRRRNISPLKSESDKLK